MVLSVSEASGVGEARRSVLALAAKLGFDEVGRGKAALVVTESATNLHKHGREGRLVLQSRQEGASTGLDVLALDKGPGIADVSRCLRDGFSTGGTLGTGLGAIARQSAVMDVYSRVPGGTALLARLWAGAAPAIKGKRFQVGDVSVAKDGEGISGDAWAVEASGRRGLVVVADGLGHGPLAAEASRTAVRVLRENVRLGLVALLEAMHAALASTRGAAVAVAEIDLDAQVIRYAGVGNISGTICASGACRSMVSHNGTIGHEARKFQEFTYPFPPGASLVMHSDGLSARWNIEAYPGLVNRDPTLIAGVLYRDWQRGRDDSTVLVVRATEGSRE